MDFVGDTSAVRCRGDKPFSAYPQANQIEPFTSSVKRHTEGLQRKFFKLSPRCQYLRRIH